jgi:sterol desaturase/sphingolipid hydroxylase (fatty acid hydroxylase superfamily)
MGKAKFVAAGVLFAWGISERPDAAIGLVVLGVVFTLLERWRPLRPQTPAWARKGASTDAVHFVTDEVFALLGLGVLLAVLAPIGRYLVPDVVPDQIQAQPTAALWLESLLLAEVAGYWGHRLTHEIPFLWRFHRVHHSAPTMDWLAPNRRHPVDQAFARLSVALPLLLLGFAVPTIAAHFIIKRFQGLFVHSNLDVRLGVLELFVATPHFHHWHHADTKEAWDKNYSGQVPLIDWMFGTLHLPDSWPERYGCDVDAPPGYVAQLAWPFRPDRPRVPTQASATAEALPATPVAAG